MTTGSGLAELHDKISENLILPTFSVTAHCTVNRLILHIVFAGLITSNGVKLLLSRGFAFYYLPYKVCNNSVKFSPRFDFFCRYSGGKMAPPTIVNAYFST